MREANLTPREIEVLECLVRGVDDTTIADDLNIKKSTVRSHLRSVFLKLKVHNRTAAALKYLRIKEGRS